MAAKPIDIMSGTDADLRYAVIKMAEALAAQATKIDVLTAKLNADGGVTDTNYATNFATTLATYVTVDATNHKVTPA